MRVVMETPSPRSDFELDSPFRRRIDKLLAVERGRDALKRKSFFAPIISQYKRARDENAQFVSSVLHRGDVILDDILEMLKIFGPSIQQKKFHKSALSGCLRMIYGKDFDKEKHRVMRKYNFKCRKQQCLITAPRRLGKTYAIAMLVIVLMYMCCEEVVSIFSPSDRQSKMLVTTILSLMRKVDLGNNIVSHNATCIVIRTKYGKTSKINAYPAVVRTLKGVEGSVLILEEMAQIPREVLDEVVIPLHQIDKACMIGISTVTDESNFMTNFLTMKDNFGENLFDVTRVYLACKPCRENGLAAKCNHNNHLLPKYSSGRKRKIINCLMKHNEELLAREIGGMASAKNARAFPGAMYQKLLNSPRYNVPRDMYIPFIFHSIDPSGAGKGSDLAVTSIMRMNGMYIVIGLEAFPARRAADIDNLIVSHVKKLRENPRFSRTLSVFILESNLGLESDHIKSMLDERLSNFVVMNERDDNTRVGFHTSNSVKCMAVESMRERINDGSLVVADEHTLVSCTSPYTMAVGTLMDQVREFTEVIKDTTVSGGKRRKFYTGKNTGKDDLVMSLLLAIHWSGFWYNAPKYATFVEALG